mgnify:CR=1 FL=1|tara:strand:+ start:443 stop:1531 length:1089 start_codon:yes stop_codon:yes gene_type:complete
MKVAIVHHWLIKMGGGEKVVEYLCDLYPEADIYTHVYDQTKISDKINKHNVNTTFIGKLPLSKKYYKHYLPLMPLALKLLNLNEYDLIISSESGPSKGFCKKGNSIHICYCHSPMRYLWDLSNEYNKKFNFLEKIVSKIVFPFLRKWDVKTAKDIDLIIANSNFVSNRIFNCWQQQSKVIHPAINYSEFSISSNVSDYYLVLSRHVPYKKIDIVIEAFNVNSKKVIIIGDGPNLKEMQKISKTENIKFLGWLDDKTKKKYLSECKALLFPGIEDFGIVPIEAMASGRPVIAYNKGGALDYVVENTNGLFFDKQTPDCLNNKINEFEINYEKFNPALIRDSVKKFDKKYFFKEINKEISKILT